MNLKQYNYLQRAIFKKYKIQSKVVTQTTEFYALCSKIATQRECELNYTTVKNIVKIVREYTKEEEKC